MHTNNDLDQITNMNGGGLSLDVTGKYTSVRHERALRDPDKLTAGEAAKRLRKMGHQITARQAVAAWRLLFKWPELEWHHSGFKPKAAGGGMGRTYFFRLEQVDQLAAKLPELAAAKAKAEAEKAHLVRGFHYTWESDYGGRYGKKRNYKRLAVYEGPAGSAPTRSFTPCDPATFEAARAAVGRCYFGWDEPSLSEFNGSGGGPARYGR